MGEEDTLIIKVLDIIIITVLVIVLMVFFNNTLVNHIDHDIAIIPVIEKKHGSSYSYSSTTNVKPISYLANKTITCFKKICMKKTILFGE